jgi:predicted phage tail protein
VITVLLYGELAKKYGKLHKYAVRNVPEAIRALEANYRGFRQAIKADGEYRVVVDKKQISEDELGIRAIETIKIVPLVQGAGRGVGQAILGIVLIAVAWWNPMGWGTVIGAAGPMAGTAAGALALSAMSSLGVSLLIGGVSQMMTKTPKLDAGADRPNNKPSYAFDGPVNTTAQGNPVPLAYGRILAGSQVISAGLEAR